MTKFGICFLSVIPLRIESADKAEIVSQLLFGEVYTILTTGVEGKWTKIKNAFDGYEGWIDSKHVKEISKSEFDTIKNSKAILVGDLFGKLVSDRTEIPVFIGTTLPSFKDGYCEVAGEKFQYNGKILGGATNIEFSNIRPIAFCYLNSPYLWGGKSLFGIDCSGFTQQVFKLCGYQLPRDAYQQEEIGEYIGFGGHLPGDVAFFADENGKITHVGLVIENNQIIHASGQVRVDLLDKKGIFNRERNIYTHNLHSIKRITV